MADRVAAQLPRKPRGPAAVALWRLGGGVARASAFCGRSRRDRGNPGETGPDETMDLRHSRPRCVSALGESPRFRRHHGKISVVLRDFDVDDFGIPRAPAAQILAYGTGILRIVEPLFPLMISRPHAISPGVPAGDLCIRSGSKCDAVGHYALLSSRLLRSCKT